MENKICNVINEMISYYKGDVKRINHFLKVYSFAKTIGELENIDKDTQFILEVSAIMHDIGIKICEEKYNSSSGKYQKKEGPAVAKDMLEELKFPKNIIDRVCFLISHHHTYTNINNIDYQILIEADFLVNIYEDEIKEPEVKIVTEKIFKTKSGIKILENLYL